MTRTVYLCERETGFNHSVFVVLDGDRFGFLLDLDLDTMKRYRDDPSSVPITHSVAAFDFPPNHGSTQIDSIAYELFRLYSIGLLTLEPREDGLARHWREESEKENLNVSA